MKSLLGIVIPSIISCVIFTAGCSTSMPMPPKEVVIKEASMNWAAFIDSIPGTSIEDMDYKTPIIKQIQGNSKHETKFGRWCASHGGKVSVLFDLPFSLTENPHYTKKQINLRFVSALKEFKQIKHYALHQPYFCTNETSQQLISVMLLIMDEKPQKSNLAFYTPPQADSFMDFYIAKKDARFEIQNKITKQRAAEKLDEIKAWRSSIRVGTKTNCGPVIEIKGDIVKIYTPVKNYGNEHWLNRDTILPPTYPCQFFDGQYKPPSP